MRSRNKAGLHGPTNVMSVKSRLFVKLRWYHISILLDFIILINTITMLGVKMIKFAKKLHPLVCKRWLIMGCKTCLQGGCSQVGRQSQARGKFEHLEIIRIYSSISVICNGLFDLIMKHLSSIVSFIWIGKNWIL